MSTNSRRRHLHRVRLAVLAALVLPALACARPEAPADEAPEFMFVQVADDIQADTVAGTLRLVDVSPQTVYFSDRPNRIAGHITMAQYLWQWTAEAGADNLAADPPNATLSVYEPGQPDNTVAIIEISEPTMDGGDLVYRYTLVEGSIPAAGGATSLFIDKVGAGGGVGAGYHGVGVGARGPGVR